MRISVRVGVATALIAISGCQPGHEPSSEPHPNAGVSDASSRSEDDVVLQNGLVGVRFALDGSNATAFSIHDYESSGEEKLRSHKLPKLPLDGGGTAKIDFRTGVVTIGSHRIVLPPGAHALSIDGKPFPLDDAKATPPATKDWSESSMAAIAIDGPADDQQAIDSMRFGLLTAIDPTSGMSVSPYGLTSTTYNGHVFWDADVWVFPALALLDPTKAKAICDYRLSKTRAAHDAAVSELRIDQTKPSAHLKFPWESSVTGKEVAPGESRKEIHISGDVAWMMRQAEAFGLTTRSREIVAGVGAYYAARATKTHPRELKDVMSPDEYHTGDNDLYTNLLAQWCVDGGRWDGPTRFKLPKDDQTFLTYDGDRLSGYKQAAAVLSVYPLQFPAAEAQALKLLDRFERKVAKNGPAMSDSIHALIRARFGDPDQAYESWRNAWKPFLYPPISSFSEKRSRPSTYFITGAGGCLQTVLYGFLGFRLDSKKVSGAAWATRLPTGDWLSIKPNLPKAWKSVRIDHFRLLGHDYAIVASHTGATVTETSVVRDRTTPTSKEK